MSSKPQGGDALDKLQRDTLEYFLKETNPRNGLVPDSTLKGAALRSEFGGHAVKSKSSG